MPEIMSGFVRMPKESSKIITQQESGGLERERERERETESERERYREREKDRE